MKITKQSRREAKQLFRSCISDGVLDENRVRKTVDEVLVERPRRFVAILSHLQRLVKLDAERHLARIESAVALTPQVQAEVKASLERRYGRGLHFQFSENPALLGGMRVQVGSDVFDGSIRTRLNEVRESFELA